MQTVTCHTCGEETEDHVRFRRVNPGCDISVHYVCMDCYHTGQKMAEQIRKSI